MGRFASVQSLCEQCVHQQGFEYLSLVGRAPLNSVGKPDRMVTAAAPQAPAVVLPAPAEAPASELTHVVPFELGFSRFMGGDKITITEVLGTSDLIEAGGTYRVTGTYHLASHDSATLALFETSRDPRHFQTQRTQFTRVSGGDGTFTVTIVIVSQDGCPHLSFYPSNGGSSFATLYFGTGSNVLRHMAGGNVDRISK